MASFLKGIYAGSFSCIQSFHILLIFVNTAESQFQYNGFYNNRFFPSQAQQPQRSSFSYPSQSYPTYQQGPQDETSYQHLNSLYQGQIPQAPYEDQRIPYANQNSISAHLNRIPYSQSQFSNRGIPSAPSHPNLIPQAEPESVRGGFSVKNGSYILEWEVTHPTITFKARRKGAGFVGFAISPSGGMSGADIFIGGIGPTGMPYANDYHHEYLPGGVGSAVPDASNDYQVLDISESQGYTTARFRRLLNTQDAREDHAIVNAEQNILWSIGPPSRGLEYHGPSNRGVVRINLLDPPAKFRLRRPLI